MKSGTYLFKDKDPIIDKLRTAIEDEDMTYSEVAETAGISVQTIYNWFRGPTRRPQYATIVAVWRALGYRETFIKGAKHVVVHANRRRGIQTKEIARSA